MRRLLWLVPLVAVLALGGIALFRSRPQAELGGPAPRFELPLLSENGERLALATLRGKPVVLNFWASWCAPCRDEAPELARAARRLSGKATFIGVNILDGREEALAYVTKYHVPYRSVRDVRAVIAKRFGVTGAPETVFIDARGDIAGKFIGAFTGQLERLVRALAALEPGEVLRITERGDAQPVP